jgi:hypothetical protein
MGHTIWVDIRDRSQDDNRQDNSIMLRLQDHLEELSAKLGVPKLSEFYDCSELEAAYGDLDGEGDDAEGVDPPLEDGQPEGSWFDPGPALAAVKALHDHLTQHPEELGFITEPSRAHWPAALMEELRHCQSVIQSASARGQQFRLLIVP